MSIRRTVATSATIALVVALAASSAGAASAAGGEIIEPTPTGLVAQIGGVATQTFRPTTTGRITEVSLWPERAPRGEAGELVLFAGSGPGASIASQAFTWTTSPQVVRLDVPVPVRAGSTYTFQASGMGVGVYLSMDAAQDPYPNGDVMLLLGTWTTWSDCAVTGGCPAWHLDHRFRIVVESGDADGDGVVDELDVCPDTVLPDPAVDELRPNRYAANATGFVDRDGKVVATLADTGGCSATQIVGERHLGDGIARYGLTRPHLDGWVAAVRMMGR